MYNKYSVFLPCIKKTAIPSNEIEAHVAIAAFELDRCAISGA